MNDALKVDLQVLAEAQSMFEFNDWKRTGSVQKELYNNSLAWGTIYEKDNKTFYLNIASAPKAIQMLRRVP